MHKIIFTILSALLSFEIYALASEAEDDPMELSTRKNCQFDGNLSEHQLKKIIKKALKGDSVSAFFLYNNLNLVKGREVTDTSEWLFLVEHKNPIAFMYITFDLLRNQSINEFEKGVIRLKISAELGFLEASYFLVRLYEGEIPGFESYTNQKFANYWRERHALSGNLFRLKEFIFDNPNKLSVEELKAWRETYEYLRAIKKGHPKTLSELSVNSKWLVKLFDRNKQNLTDLLKLHHDVYADYKYCMNK